MSSKDELGDRMKALEAAETERKFDPTLPVYARIDGRGFSKFTKDMTRPFDQRMTDSMIHVTKYLVEHTHAAMGYVQSDEISLVWDGNPVGNDLFFAGKIQKSCSVLASMSAASFAVALQDNFGSLGRAYPHFDCRVLQVPSQVEAANMMLWRSLDARKNSISMLARHYFSHKELMNKSGKEMIAMMAERGVSLDQHPAAFTRGTWIRRKAVSRLLTAAELAAIPEQHRPDPAIPVVRSSVDVINMPPFVEVTNRVDVVFSSAKPEV